MDLQLPGIDGTETLRRLRADILDAAAGPGRRRDRLRDDRRTATGAADAGFDGYVEKPISVRALPAQVATFLPREGPARDDRPGDRARGRRPAAEPPSCSTPCSARGATGSSPRRSGEEALAVHRDEPVDLVLLDILMPGMDGYEVCRRIRANAATAFLPVVMITASGEQEKSTRPRGGRGRLRHQAVRPERAAGPGGLAGADQALPRHNPTAGRRACRLERRAREPRVQAQVEELERTKRLRRFLSPSWPTW